MRDTVGARLFICALAGVLSLLTASTPALAADKKAATKNDEFRGSVTASGEIKDHNGNLVGKVVMDSAGATFDLSKMTIREDGAVTTMDGKIVGHLMMNFDKPVKPKNGTAGSGAPLRTGISMTATPVAAAPPRMTPSNTNMVRPPAGSQNPGDPIMKSNSATTPLASAPPPSTVASDLVAQNDLGAILGGLNTPGAFPDVSVQVTDNLTGGNAIAGSIPSPNIAASLGAEPGAPAVGGSGEIRSALTHGAPPPGTLGFDQALRTAETIGGLNAPGAFPQVSLATTDNILNVGRGGGIGMIPNPAGGAVGTQSAAGGAVNNTSQGMGGGGVLAAGLGGGSNVGTGMGGATLAGGGAAGAARISNLGSGTGSPGAAGGGAAGGFGVSNFGSGTGSPTIAGGGTGGGAGVSNLGAGSTGTTGGGWSNQQNSGGGGGSANAGVTNYGAGANSNNISAGGTTGGIGDVNFGGGSGSGAGTSRGSGITNYGAGANSNNVSAGGAAGGIGNVNLGAGSGSAGSTQATASQNRNPEFQANIERNSSGQQSTGAMNSPRSGATEPRSSAASGTNGANSIREAELAGLKERTSARIESALKDGLLTKKQAASLNKEIAAINKEEKKFQKDGSMKAREVNSLYKQWDQIMNTLSSLVEGNEKKKR